MEAKAKVELAALLMNMVSLKIAQYEVVTADGHTAGDVLTYVSVLIEDGNASNDELAKDLAEQVNLQQTIDAGIIPEGSILYKGSQGIPFISWSFGVPDEYALYNNYPNPFNPSTRIQYDLPVEGFVTLKVYNMVGQEVVTLVSDNVSAGRYEVEWNASGIASGVYLYRLEIGEFVHTRKLLLLK